MADTHTRASTTSEGDAARTDRRGWLAACMGPNTSKRDRRNSRIFGALIVAWALSTVVRGMLGVSDGEPTGAAIGFAVLSFVLFVAAAAAMAHFIRETDELNRVIQLRSIAVAFAAGIVTVIGADLLVEVGVIETVGLDVIATVMLISAGLAQLAWTASYHR